MFKVTVLNTQIVLENQDMVEALNLKLHQFLSWLNTKNVRCYVKYSKDRNLILTLLKKYKIILVRYNQQKQWQRATNIDRNLILTQPFMPEECFGDRFIKTERQLANQIPSSKYINDYCDSSWSPNDVLLGLTSFKQNFLNC